MKQARPVFAAILCAGLVLFASLGTTHSYADSAAYMLIENTMHDTWYRVDDAGEMAALTIAAEDAAMLKEQPVCSIYAIEAGQMKTSYAAWDKADIYRDWDAPVPALLLTLLPELQNADRRVYPYSFWAGNPMQHDSLMEALRDTHYDFYNPSRDIHERYSYITAYYTRYDEDNFSENREIWFAPAALGDHAIDDVFVLLRDWLLSEKAADAPLLFDESLVNYSHSRVAQGEQPAGNGRRITFHLNAPLTFEQQAEIESVLSDATSTPPYCDTAGNPSGHYFYIEVNRYPLVLLSDAPVPQDELLRIAETYGLEME